MSLDFYTSAFHPKALNNVCPDSYRENWQVFWLGVYFNAFPLYTVAKIEASLNPSFGGDGETLYSYGDSSGIPVCRQPGHRIPFSSPA